MNMFDPKIIYTGMNSILRNLMPGILILLPIFEGIIDSIDLDWYIFSYYLIISVVSHFLFEMIGYAFLNFNKKTVAYYFFCFISIVLLPSYFLYRYRIEIFLKQIINEEMSFEKYRQIQDAVEYKNKHGDHEYIHRFNSFMICFDIASIGLFLILMIIFIVDKGQLAIIDDLKEQFKNLLFIYFIYRILGFIAHCVFYKYEKNQIKRSKDYLRNPHHVTEFVIKNKTSIII